MLGISVVQAVGHLHFLWWWALDYADDGNLNTFDSSDIADAGQWDGDPDAFLMAMVTTKFLDDSGDGRFQIHDWLDYAGRLVERRKDNAERMRMKRAEHVQRTCNARTGATVPNPTVPNPTVPNPTVPDQTIPNLENAAPDGAETISPPAKKPRARRKSESAEEPEGFQEFWEAYPRKVGRAVALRAYSKCLQNGTTANSLAEAAGNYSQECNMIAREWQFICFPSTFLNQLRFEDYREPPNARIIANRSARGSPEVDIDKLVDQTFDMMARGGSNFGKRTMENGLEDTPRGLPRVQTDNRTN